MRVKAGTQVQITTGLQHCEENAVPALYGCVLMNEQEHTVFHTFSSMSIQLCMVTYIKFQELLDALPEFGRVSLHRVTVVCVVLQCDEKMFS